jgi:Ca2+-binding EF-hand superfamily protein
MLNRRAVFAAAFVLTAGPVLAADALKKFDPDKDGTVDLAEAKKAAGDLFDRLDKDHEGTLDIKELQGRLSRADFAGADPDKDKTLTKDEYLAVVEQRFKAADSDNEGTLDAAELKTPAGKALLRLMK